MSSRRVVGLARTQQIQAMAEQISAKCHFNTEECRGMLRIHEAMNALGKVDRLRFREFLHSCFDITDDIMLDLCFHGFDRNNDGVVDESEFIIGLSSMLRGDAEELIEICYYVYDMNGDRSLAREELFHCLKGCMVPGYGLDAEDIEDAEKEIVEIAMRKLDTNRDGQITYDDFQNAVRADALLVQACGPCLPTTKTCATFLATITEDYRTYTGVFGGTFDAKRPVGGVKSRNYTLMKSVVAMARERDRDSHKDSHKDEHAQALAPATTH